MKHKHHHHYHPHHHKLQQSKSIVKSKVIVKLKTAKTIKWRMNPEAIKTNLLEMKKIFDDSRMKFWLTHGTLLGPIRQKNFIPSDRDIDLRILAVDWFPELVDKFKAAGFRAKTVRHYLPYITKVMLTKRQIKTDLALEYYYKPENVYLCLALEFREPMVRVLASFYKEDHFIEFLGTSFRVPYPPEKLLEQYYGKDWRIPTSAFPGWRKGGELLNVQKYLQWFAQHPEEIPKGMI